MRVLYIVLCICQALIKLFYLAESIGFEPIQRFPVDGLAIHSITILATFLIAIIKALFS